MKENRKYTHTHKLTGNTMKISEIECRLTAIAKTSAMMMATTATAVCLRANGLGEYHSSTQIEIK